MCFKNYVMNFHYDTVKLKQFFEINTHFLYEKTKLFSLKLDQYAQQVDCTAIYRVVCQNSLRFPLFHSHIEREL